MSKFKVGDLVQEVCPCAFTPGAVLVVIKEGVSTFYCTTVTGGFVLPVTASNNWGKHKRWCINEDALQPVEDMEEPFEYYPWQPGDKVYAKFSTDKKPRKLRIMVGPEGAEGDPCRLHYYDQRQEINDACDLYSSFGQTFKPRGKVTKQRYAQWLDQNIAYRKHKRKMSKLRDRADEILRNREAEKFEVGDRVRLKEDCCGQKAGYEFTIKRLFKNHVSGDRICGTHTFRCEKVDKPSSVEELSWGKAEVARSLTVPDLVVSKQYAQRYRGAGFKPEMLYNCTSEELTRLVRMNKEYLRE